MLEMRIMDLKVMKCCCFALPLFLLFFSGTCQRNPVMFIFGDSNSDTGAYSSGLGITFGSPNGRTHFNRPSGRLCDGRLVVDFLCENLNTSYLTPYLEPLGSNFTNGVNFAYSGAATFPQYRPFSLDVQVLQFLRFRSHSPLLISQGYKNLVTEEAFQYALHIIDIGQNDLAGSFEYLPFDQVIKNIPFFITEIDFAIQGIYQHGGRNFWVHNTGPLGCLPQKLAGFANKATEYDRHGCIKSLNDAATEFNKQLLVLCEELRSNLKNITIVHVDMYSIKYDLIANASIYGFENPLMACCGYGGPPYNYNQNVRCGGSGHVVCDEGSKYVSWDGIHYTEAANAVFSSKILSAKYSSPPITFDSFLSS